MVGMVTDYNVYIYIYCEITFDIVLVYYIVL